MVIDPDACYRALTARDARFDGVFFVGVKTTGIYCRPVCTAKTPGRDRCRFFPSAALAEQAGFRPCLRCRPELAPGQAPMDAVRSTARIAALRIEAGAMNNGSGLEHLAADLGLSARQLRRAVRQELGISPVELAQTTRLLLAKKLIAETTLPMIQVAFASGFESVRRFNSSFRTHYRLTPTSMRRGKAAASGDNSVQLTLAFRPPYAWPSLARFLQARATAGVECVTDGVYRRTLAVGKDRGWLCVSPPGDRNLLSVELSTSLVPALPVILPALRNLFDLDARPDVIASALRGEPKLHAVIKRAGGLRVPGAMDGFELAVRAILGQQVSVAAASTLSGRLAARFGEPIETPQACLNRLTPTAERLAAARINELTDVGITKARAESIRELARAVARRELRLSADARPEEVVAQLVELPGIGSWTAEYVAMRALRRPDAFPAGDLGLIKASGLKSAALLKAAEAWRPWRAYAAMHLWESLHPKSKND